MFVFLVVVTASINFFYNRSQENPALQSGDELSSDMPSSLRGIPAVLGWGGRHKFAQLDTYAEGSSVIDSITDNRNSYPNGKIPKYEKIEITFEVKLSSATNYFYPYDNSPPSGIIPKTGINVDAIFTSPDGTLYKQPGFYYQEFLDQVKSGKEWFYPTENYKWKVRFSPNKEGTWKYKLKAIDSSGTVESQEQTFNVISSANHGFIKVSRDSRYFEYDDGTYFPALGFNLNGGDLDNVNPALGNTPEFKIMGENGIQLSRVWISQFSIYGEAWGKWGSHNRVHQTQEPRMGIVNPVNSQFTSNYPNLTPPSLPSGSEYYMWLEFNETVSPDGTQQRFTPCRYVSQIPVKQNTRYRVRVRYKDINIEGPRVAGQSYGFAVKTTSNFLSSSTGLCNDTSAGTVVAATFNQGAVSADPQNPGWSYLAGTFNSGTSDFIPNFYLTFHNVKSQDSDLVAGHVFIDKVWLEEDSCPTTNVCPNLLSKSWMSMHQYINERDAYSFDKLVDLAHQYGIYLKAVMLEKNDRIFQTIGYNGEALSNQDDDFFYGNGRTLTKVRWLQQAWWRYMQARWGYSVNIHSWELLNEGDPGNSKHLIQADEFGKYMKCRAFGVEPVEDAGIGKVCRNDHPNDHLVSTSFWGGAYPWRFWNNSDSLYADIDYADQHLYATEGETDPAQFNDSAYFSYWLSTLPNLWGDIGKRKPFIRGETAWSFPGTNLLEVNAEGGEWLHDFIWAQINHGGLLEHFFGGGHFTRQLYNLNANLPYDHRAMFGTYYRFIKDVPLNNGNYRDATAVVTNSNLRVWGQKDTINGRAHLWIANKNHTWKSVTEGVVVSPISGNVTMSGFRPNTDYKVEWWDTYQGQITSTVIQNSNANGEIVLAISSLVTDKAVRIGDYSESNTTPSFKPGDGNGDGRVDGADFIIWLTHFGQSTTRKNLDGDFDGNGTVQIADYRIWISNYR